MDGITPSVSESHEDRVIAVRAETERLRREHHELKARLSELNSRIYLSPAEEVERKTLQKLKLAKKDRIAALSGHLGMSQ